MTEADREPFFTLLGNVYAFYRADFTAFVGNVWWTAMQPYDLATVNDAMGRHCANPDTGQFLPKPADVVRMLQGSTLDSALVAWAKVDRALRQVGTWQSVVFDDALIHRVLHDMGGWLALERKTEDDWPFVGKEFQNRYRGYRGRNERPEYPPVLVGATQAHNSRVGGDAPAPVLIGDIGRARAVLAGGTTSPLVGFSQVTRPELLALAVPNREAA